MSIKLLIGGSPCTYWSIAQKNNRETTAEGIGWELFKNYLIAKEKFKPDFFLYENNKSASQAIKDQIAQELGVGVDPMARFTYINSALVSAQNRQRFYVTNFGEIQQPADRGILLQDILETGGIAFHDKSYALTTRCQGAIPNDFFEKHRHTMVSESIAIESIGDCKTIKKSLSALTEKYGYVPERFNAYNLSEITDKSPTLSTGSMVTSSCATTILEPVLLQLPHGFNEGGIKVEWRDGKTYPIYEVESNTICIKDKEYPVKLPDGFYIIRKLTVTECCRLQTMPDDYCKAVSATQAYKGLGNGWTAEVIIHLLNHALKDLPRDEEIVVLSMYDGIGTGRYCLEKMGFTNVKYHAYEIDKHAMTIANDNYPDIVQHGDAFAVREDDWKPPQTRSQWLDELLGGASD